MEELSARIGSRKPLPSMSDMSLSVIIVSALLHRFDGAQDNRVAHIICTRDDKNDPSDIRMQRHVRRLSSRIQTVTSDVTLEKFNFIH